MTANRYQPPEWPPSYSAGERARTGPPPYAGQVPAARHSVITPPDRRPGPQHGTGEWRTIRERSAPRKPTGGRTRREDASHWHWLLLVPIVLPLMPGLYNRIEPTVLGIPFFYWCQLSFAFLASAVITFVHRKVRVTGAGDG